MTRDCTPVGSLSEPQSARFSPARQRGVFTPALTRTAPKVMILLLAIAAPAFPADQTPAEQGRAVYQKWCAPCHGTGLGKPGTAAATAHGAKPAVLEERTDLTPKMLETAVRKGESFMPRFRKTEVSNTELAAIVAYLTHK